MACFQLLPPALQIGENTWSIVVGGEHGTVALGVAVFHGTLCRSDPRPGQESGEGLAYVACKADSGTE